MEIWLHRWAGILLLFRQHKIAVFIGKDDLFPFDLLGGEYDLRILFLTTAFAICSNDSVRSLHLGSDIALQHRVGNESPLTTIPDKAHAGAEGACNLVGIQLGLAHVVVAQHFCGEVLLHQAGQDTHFHFGGSVCGKFKIRFGQTLVVAQIEKVSGIDAGFTQLEACHVQKVADIERDFQTMDTLMLVGGDKQQAFIHQIFFVQRRTGKNDGQCFFFRHG